MRLEKEIVLAKNQVGAYQGQGFLFPLPVLSSGETNTLRSRLEALEAQYGGRLPALINRKPHLLVTWLNLLIRHPRILDPVADILGPDILCWGSGFFIKNPRDPGRVTWLSIIKTEFVSCRSREASGSLEAG